jgi:hypothetical protein
LKIDKSFVGGLGEDVEDTAIVRMIIELAHTLDMAIIAEGVETEEQETLLREMGCDFAQGYLFAKPLPPRSGVGVPSRLEHPRHYSGFFITNTGIVAQRVFHRQRRSIPEAGDHVAVDVKRDLYKPNYLDEVASTRPALRPGPNHNRRAACIKTRPAG